MIDTLRGVEWSNLVDFWAVFVYLTMKLTKM